MSIMGRSRKLGREQQTPGSLRVQVIRGVNLAVRDFRSSDPYVVLKMGRQKLKTSVIKKNVNPVWNEGLTLIIEDSFQPVKLEVYDKDTFSFDDPMGHAEFDVQPLVEAVKVSYEGVPDNTIIQKLMPCMKNCLVDESNIYLLNGKVVQDIILRLRDVECGEVELQLQWYHIPRF